MSFRKVGLEARRDCRGKRFTLVVPGEGLDFELSEGTAFTTEAKASGKTALPFLMGQRGVDRHQLAQGGG